MWVPSLAQKEPLEKEMATHSNIVAWEIPWTEKPVGLQFMGSKKSWAQLHDWTTTQLLDCAFFFSAETPTPALLRYACMLSCFRSVSLCDAMGCSLPASFVHGILQARILEWIVMPFSRDLPDSGIKPMSLCLLHWQAGFLPLVSQGSPYWGIIDNDNYVCLKDTVWWFHVCTYWEMITTVKLIKTSMGLPWCISGKEYACQCRRHRFDLGPGRSHMPRSMWCMGHDYWACALEPVNHDYWAHVL